VLRELGHTIHTLESVYGEAKARTVDDTEWLNLAGEHGWIVLTKDKRIRRNPYEFRRAR
jgi:hypothetical protein